MLCHLLSVSLVLSIILCCLPWHFSSSLTRDLLLSHIYLLFNPFTVPLLWVTTFPFPDVLFSSSLLFQVILSSLILFHGFWSFVSLCKCGYESRFPVLVVVRSQGHRPSPLLCPRTLAPFVCCAFGYDLGVSFLVWLTWVHFLKFISQL